MQGKLFFNTLLAGALLALGCDEEKTPTEPKPVTKNIEFITHITGALPEQDVFVMSNSDPNMVERIKGNAASDPANLAKPVYASAVAVPHDFFELGPNPLGPFPRGQALGFTLGEWLAATGKGTYTIIGEDAVLEVSFQHLVPKGVYTFWCGRINLPPNFRGDDIPCGKIDGSENTFIADAIGNATFKLKMRALPASTPENIQDLAIAYHSDGKTYGAYPGEFGKVTHVQLFISEPPPAP